jgi:hypothetical protein
MHEKAREKEKFWNHLGKQPTSFGSYKSMLAALGITVLNSEFFDSSKQVENKRLFLF